MATCVSPIATWDVKRVFRMQNRYFITLKHCLLTLTHHLLTFTHHLRRLNNYLRMLNHYVRMLNSYLRSTKPKASWPFGKVTTHGSLLSDGMSSVHDHCPG